MSDTEPGSDPDETLDTGSNNGPTPELAHDDAPPAPGRPVRLEPTPPGFRRLILGGALAVLAPLFGVLMGTSAGSEDTASAMDPLYWGFFIGGLIGLIGLVVAATGGLRLIRATPQKSTEEPP